MPAFLFIPLLIWARVALNRHDLTQSLAGALLGLGLMFAALAMPAGHCPGADMLCA